MSERVVVSREGSETADDVTMGGVGLFSRRLVCASAVLLRTSSS